MHKIHHTIRRIADADLPVIRELDGSTRAATDGELLDHGIARIAPGVYSCVEQLRRDPETLDWEPVGHPPVGELLAHGMDRFHALPDELRDQVLRAEVIVSETPEQSAVEVTEAVISEQASAIAEFVGQVDGAPLVDLSGPDVIAAEARRLSVIADSGVTRALIPVADVDEAAHIVEATDIPPHSWAGEPRRRR